MDTVMQGVGARAVLVVDDEEAVRNVTAATLELFGYSVLLAANANDALALMARENTIDLVLTDIAMPGLSGLELGARLAQLKPRLPVVYMSGYVEPWRDPRAQGAHHVHFIEKPFSAAILVDLLEHALACAATGAPTSQSGLR